MAAKGPLASTPLKAKMRNGTLYGLVDLTDTRIRPQVHMKCSIWDRASGNAKNDHSLDIYLFTIYADFFFYIFFFPPQYCQISINGQAKYTSNYICIFKNTFIKINS